MGKTRQKQLNAQPIASQQRAHSSTQTPNYRVRVSQRAKHVSIKVSNLGEVEVVIPQEFDRSQIPAILNKRQEWIAKAIQQVEQERQLFRTESSGTPPQQLLLRSLAEEWQINYRQTADATVTAHTLPGYQILVSGQTQDLEACKQLLRRWLNRKGQLHLVPWLRRVSREIDLSYGKTSVRGQKTLWASCSSKKAISLNYKLLFLPPALVQYVFVHELCHTVHLDHSDAFWALVAQKEPNYLQLDKETGKAWRYVPEWVERSPT